jgi:hypothetical protein
MAHQIKNFSYKTFERWIVYFAFSLATLTLLTWLTRWSHATEDPQSWSSSAENAPIIEPPTEPAYDYYPDVSDNNAYTQSTQADILDSTDSTLPISAYYFAILYGPALKDTSSFQPLPEGGPDSSRPVIVKNYGTLGYALNSDIGVSATAHWIWKPVQGHSLDMRDPYLRIAHNRLINFDNFNVYADVRVHFGVSNYSREDDLLTGIQAFQILTYTVPDTRLTLGSYISTRYNIFGKQGWGNDLELYVGPNLSYRISRTVALTLLYEMGSSHFFGDKPGYLTNDGTDLEPGILWDITPKLTINPYLNLYTGNKVTWDSTSIGMTMSWQLL